MREVRIFELEHGEPAAAWRVARPAIFKVISGEIWLTVEGEHDDHWLATGESIELARGSVAWISAGADGARFALASGSERKLQKPLSGWLMPGWLGRRPGVV
jgi:quercetin dioxygenase-like cupin family protein